MNDTIIIIIRQVLLVGGGALVSKGYIDQAGLDSVIGAALVIIAAVWRYIDAHKKRVELKVAIEAPAIVDPIK